MQAIGRQPTAAIRAPDGVPVHYERHRPEQTMLYRLVRMYSAPPGRRAGLRGMAARRTRWPVSLKAPQRAADSAVASCRSRR